MVVFLFFFLGKGIRFFKNGQLTQPPTQNWTKSYRYTRRTRSTTNNHFSAVVPTCVIKMTNLANLSFDSDALPRSCPSGCYPGYHPPPQTPGDNQGLDGNLHSRQKIKSQYRNLKRHARRLRLPCTCKSQYPARPFCHCEGGDKQS